MAPKFGVYLCQVTGCRNVTEVKQMCKGILPSTVTLITNKSLLIILLESIYLISLAVRARNSHETEAHNDWQTARRLTEKPPSEKVFVHHYENQRTTCHAYQYK